MLDAASLIQKIVIWAPPILFAVTLHEVSHGWAARYFGDHTAERMGRLSLNPLKHVDLIGTVVVPAVTLLVGGIIFGWAKPVPVVASNMSRPRQDMAVVALAGPLTNLAMALAWGVVLKLCMMVGAGGFITYPLSLMARVGIPINLVLMVLNLLPVPPLDGSRVLNGLLPERYAQMVDKVEPYGLIILVLLLFSGVLGRVLGWPLTVLTQVVYRVLGI